MNEKILQNYRLIYKVMNDLHCINDEEVQDEVFFEGLMGLYNGIKTYNPDKGTKETTYFYRCIKYAIVQHFNYKTCLKRDYKKNEISIYTPINEIQTIEDTLISDVDIEKEIIEKEQFEIIVNTLNKLKNTMWKQYLCEFYGIGQPQKNIREIALKYGVKEHAIRSSILQGIKKLRKKIKEKE